MNFRTICTTYPLRHLAILTVVISGTLIAQSAFADAVPTTIGWFPVPNTTVAGYNVNLLGEDGRLLGSYDAGLPSVQDGVMQITVPVDRSYRFVVAISTYDEAGFVSALSPELEIESESQNAEEAAIRRLVGLRYNSPVVTGSPEIGGEAGAIPFVQQNLAAGTHVTSCDFAGNGEPEALMSQLFASDPTMAARVSPGLLLVFHQPDPNEYVAIRHAMVGSELPAAVRGDTRPACGDLDGDGRSEVVVGFGAGGDNVVEIVGSLDHFSHAHEPATGDEQELWTVAPQLLDDGGNGATRPAIGDIDGDGLGELIIAFEGELGRTRILILDDAEHDFAPFDSPALASGLLGLGDAPSEFAGVVVPIVEDLDGDGRMEIIVAFADASGLTLQIFDDALGGFSVLD